MKTLYIHKLADLNRKSADIESVYMIRELKRITKSLPDRDTIVNHLSDFLISETDINTIETALTLISPTVEMIQVLLDRQAPDLYEPINLQRAIQLVNNLSKPLQSSLDFGKSIFFEQINLITEAADALHSIPELKTKEEKVEANTKLSRIFDKILRNNKDFYFYYDDIVHEGQIQSIDSLSKAIPKGFFFHITLEEELKKLEFSLIKVRIPEEKLNEVYLIEKNIEVIKKGIQRAYEINQRMIQCSVTIYTYLKWMMGG